jgi:hypothetical protein
MSCIVGCLRQNFSGSSGLILPASFIVALAIALVATAGNIPLSILIAGGVNSAIAVSVATWCYFSRCRGR